MHSGKRSIQENRERDVMKEERIIKCPRCGDFFPVASRCPTALQGGEASKIIQESIDSHQSWISYLEKNPDKVTDHERFAGDLEHHRKCIVGYDKVLNEIDRLTAHNKRLISGIEAIESQTYPDKGNELDCIKRIATFCNWATGQIEGKLIESTAGPYIQTPDKHKEQECH